VPVKQARRNHPEDAQNSDAEAFARIYHGASPLATAQPDKPGPWQHRAVRMDRSWPGAKAACALRYGEHGVPGHGYLACKRG